MLMLPATAHTNTLKMSEFHQKRKENGCSICKRAEDIYILVYITTYIQTEDGNILTNN